jgi:polyisoprenyl-phosphate glycosyltransferase
VLLNEVLSANFEKYEIVCVNDASDDESVSIIKETAKEFRGCVLSIVNMSFYHGIESSMNAGIDLAIGDFVYEFDNCYVDYDSSLIIDLYHQSLTGYDVVTATNGKNRFTSKLFYNLYNASSNHKSDLNGETFRILSRRAINRIHSMSKTIPYRKALHAGCGLKLYALSYRPLKSTKISKTRQVNKHRQDTAITTFILFTDLAYRFFYADDFDDDDGNFGSSYL